MWKILENVIILLAALLGGKIDWNNTFLSKMFSSHQPVLNVVFM